MIKATNIRKSYGKRCILDSVSFEAKPGECVTIVGKNGCGKTTLLKMLAGAMKPDGGKLEAYGHDLFSERKNFRKYIGYVPQDNPLLEELSVKDNLKLWGVYESPIFKSLDERFGLTEMERMTVSRLSGGMKKRLSIACALAGMPPVMLMDEPEAALDLYYKDEIRQWVKDFQDQGGIVILTTHDEQEILKSDRCLVLSKGKMTELKDKMLTIDIVKQYM